MPTDPKTLPEKYPGYLADHAWVHVTRDHPRAAPPVGIFDSPAACCIELNVLWSSHVIGALGALLQRDAWTGDNEEIDRATQQIEIFINRLVQPCEEDCMSYRLRQNPANQCQLQQSLDGGLSWILAFDFSLCSSAVIENTTNVIYVQNLTNTYNELITNITNLYDGTPESVAPETVYDSDPDETALRDRALCYAVNRAVTVVCDMVIKGIEERQSQAGLAALAIGAGVAVFIGATLLTGGLAAVAAMGAYATAGVTVATAASGFISWAETVIGNHSKEPFQDMAARAEVACCWYNAMKGATVTETVFNHSLDDCTFTGNAQEIRDVIHASNQIQAEYLQFTQLFQQSIGAERAEILPPCPCETWEYLVDPSAPPAGLNIFFGTPSGDHWSSAVDEGSFEGVAFYIDFGVNASITGFSLSMRDGSGIEGSAVANRFYSYTDAPAGVGTIVASDNLPIQDADWTVDDNFAAVTARSLNVDYIFETCAFELFDLKIRGMGTNPFA